MFGSVGMGKNTCYCRDSHRIHVWYINMYLHLVDSYGKRG